MVICHQSDVLVKNVIHGVWVRWVCDICAEDGRRRITGEIREKEVGGREKREEEERGKRRREGIGGFSDVSVDFEEF